MDSGSISDLALALIIAGATLVGAAIGGVIVAYSTVTVENRRAEREEARERAARERDIRRAARLVIEELTRNAATIDAMDFETGRAQPGDVLERRVWDEQKATLAQIDDREAWLRVLTAYAFLLRVEHAGGDVKAVADFGRDSLIESIEAAQALLHEYE